MQQSQTLIFHNDSIGEVQMVGFDKDNQQQKKVIKRGEYNICMFRGRIPTIKCQLSTVLSSSALLPEGALWRRREDITSALAKVDTEEDLAVDDFEEDESKETIELQIKIWHKEVVVHTTRILCINERVNRYIIAYFLALLFIHLIWLIYLFSVHVNDI